MENRADFQDRRCRYQVAYRRALVIGATTDVDIAAGSAGLQWLRPAPNPAREFAHRVRSITRIH